METDRVRSFLGLSADEAEAAVVAQGGRAFHARIIRHELLQRGVRAMRRQILPLGLSDRQQLLTDADDVDLLLGRPLTGTARGLLKHEIPSAEGDDHTN